MDGDRAVLGSGEVPVLEGDRRGWAHPRLSAGRGWDLPPCPEPCPLLLSWPDKGLWLRCAQGGARCWRRAGKDSVML